MGMEPTAMQFFYPLSILYFGFFAGLGEGIRIQYFSSRGIAVARFPAKTSLVYLLDDPTKVTCFMASYAPKLLKN